MVTFLLILLVVSLLGVLFHEFMHAPVIDYDEYASYQDDDLIFSEKVDGIIYNYLEAEDLVIKNQITDEDGYFIPCNSEGLCKKDSKVCPSTLVMLGSLGFRYYNYIKY